ncbi:hypothetical protein QBC36DRAFT_365875 [Triangularia setosa]|uniref:Uncharacterized protein n=1 Tax=Triangularia setosa TaxID=2587417 RepID=A0AAN7A339_9PEZI|nr:hypothetical protein QBC36DRAFT_365875 [Podospora setosa]
MLAQNILLLIAANLVATMPALDNSPKPINLEATELQRRAACAVAGVVNGQCGRYYRGTGCNDMINAIDPGRCSGTCYSSGDAIGSVKASGDGTYGTNCQVFYDSNCQNPIGQTGNSITGGGKCYTPPDGRTGHSMLCWFRC